MNSNKSNSLGKFYLVLLIFFVPMITSWFVYYFHQQFHLKTLNHGQLISPSINVSYLYPASERKMWRVVHIDNGRCDTMCDTINYQLNQVRKVFGKDQNRLTVVHLSASHPFLKKFQQEFNLKQQSSIESKIYLVDPLGNLFMVYSETAKPMDIYKDLKRVLEVSQIG